MHFFFPDLFCMEGDFSHFQKRSQESIFGLVYIIVLLQGPTLLIFPVIVLQKRALIDYSYEHLACLHNFLYLAFCLPIYVCLQGLQLPQSIQKNFHNHCPWISFKLMQRSFQTKFCLCFIKKKTNQPNQPLLEVSIARLKVLKQWDGNFIPWALATE